MKIKLFTKKPLKPLLLTLFLIFFFALFAFLKLSTLNVYAEYWEKVTLPSSGQRVDWLDVFFLNQNTGWACGRSQTNSRVGKVARTTDGGKTWSVVDLNRHHLERVHFADANNGFCSGPDGIFKSTDGGVTWQGINFLNGQIDARTIDMWGCYMLSKDTIFAVGGGCVSNRSRIIWRSIDGGNTWQSSVLNGKSLPSGNTNYLSGLTHIIVRKNGIGYAVSSGLIWKTTDFGDNWNIFSVTNYSSMAWHESIANIQGTNTFLVPYSGNDCNGGNYNVGGMYFTSDGYNWKKDTTVGSMFGSWLLSETEGWTCGFYRGVYHTKNAGVTWQLKNCGIEANDNLDDIFFLNPTTGWLVGNNIYKFAPTKLLVSKKNIDFGVLCVSSVKYDTIIVSPKTFDSSYIEINKLLDNPNYRIISPNFPVLKIPPCNDIQIIVEYNPKGNFGFHEYQFEIKMTPVNENIVLTDTVYYQGLVKIGNDIKSNIDTLDFGDIPVATKKIDSIIWMSAELDTIYKVITAHNSSLSDVTLYGSQFILYPDSNNSMYFSVCPQDTGLHILEYKFIFKSCNMEKSIFVKFNGISPVLMLPEYPTVITNIPCPSDTLIKIPIYSIGNDTLKISAIELSLNGLAKGEIIGLSKNNLSFPISIAPKNDDTLLVKVSNIDTGEISVKIIVYSNDSLRINSANPNIKTIYHIIAEKSNINKITHIVDFKDVCINHTNTKTIEILNTGNTILFLPITRSKFSEYIFQPNAVISVFPNDTVKYRVTFSPTKIGNFIDTVKLLAQPCDLEYEIILQGRGVQNDIEVIPSTINKKFNVLVNYQIPIKIKSHSTQEITIDSAKLSLPSSSNNNGIQINTKFPITLVENSEFDINLLAYSYEEKIITTRLILYYSSECFDSLIIPITIEFLDNHIEYTDVFNNPVLEFTNNLYCSTVKRFDTIFVNNTQDYILKSIHLANNLTEYKIETDLNLPQTISANSKIAVVVSFELKDENIYFGIYNEILIFEILNPNTNKVKFDTLYLSHIFQKSMIVVKNNFIDFGSFEKCENAITKTLTIYNYGSLDDTCYFDLTNLSQCFSVGEPINDINFITVPANDSVDVVFICIPELTKNNSTIEETIPMRVSICPANFDIILKYKSEDIQLLLTPKTIDYGNVWINEEKFDTLKITNPTSFDIEITDFNFSAYNENFHHNFSIPFLLKSQQKIEIPISFSSDLDAIDFSTLLNIKAKRFCEINEQIPVFASVPEEIYTVDIRWSKTEAIPGKSTIIEAFIINPVPELVTEFFDFNIGMDYKLFHPQKIYFYDENHKEHRLDYVFKYPDGISAKITGNNAKNIFSIPRKFLRIEGLALLSTPDVTPVLFDKLEAKTNKYYKIEQIEGEFALTDYCKSNGIRGSLIFLPTFEAEVSQKEIDNNLEIVFNATGDISVTVEIFDIIGSLVLRTDFDLKNGKQKFLIKTDNLQVGKYFIKFGSNFHEHKVQQIIISK